MAVLCHDRLFTIRAMGFSSTRIKAASAFLVGFIVAGVASALAAVYYVDINSSTPTAPYASWATAATNIQDAIDAASDGDQILVTNGVYQTGGRIVYGSQTNRVALTNAVMLLSVNGSQATTLVGAFNTRGALVGSNSVLSGFTITNGQSRGGGDLTNEASGGGIWCATGGVVSNCVVTGCHALSPSGWGGGIYGGAIWNSVLTNNYAGYGGAAARAALNNCIIASNSAPYSPGLGYGGGIYFIPYSTLAINLSYASSKEVNVFTFRTGFLF